MPKAISEFNILSNDSTIDRAERLWGMLNLDCLDINFYNNNKSSIACLDGHNKNVYIVEGSECPICYEPIVSHKNAYLTECNHAFHKTCLTKWYEAKETKENSVDCPMCRQDPGEFDWILDGMMFNKTNARFSLEDFEMYPSYIPIQKCMACKEVIGTKRKTCNKCNIWAYEITRNPHRNYLKPDGI